MNRRRKTDGEPSPEDLLKAELLEKFRGMSPEMKRPSANRVMLAADPAWSQKTKSFLMGMSDDNRPWEQQAWLAATDTCGCGTPAAEILDLFVWAVGGFDDPERLDTVLRSVANAYSKPRRPHREFRGGGTGGIPEDRSGPSSNGGTGLEGDRDRRRRVLDAGGSGPGMAAVPGPGRAPRSMASGSDDVTA